MTSNRMNEIVDVLPIVERVANDVSLSYGIERDEVYGLLSLEVVQRAKDYLILLRDGQTQLIEYRLSLCAAKYARSERIRKGQESGQYFYDPRYVRLFLPFFFAYEDWPNGPGPEDACEDWRTAEAVDTALDIKRAWPLLRDKQSEVILARHVGFPPDADGGVDWDRIAQAIGRKNDKSAREAYTDATRELAVRMSMTRVNRQVEHDGPGAREAISNARSRALISANH